MKKILIAIIICLSLNSVYGQDKVKISELPVYTGTPAGALVPVVVGGINRKMDGYYFASMKIDSVWFVGNTLYVKKNGVTVSSDHTHPQSQITNLADSLLARYTKTEIQALLTLKLNISDSAAMLYPYARTQRLTDSLAAAQSRIQTKEPLLGYTPVPNTRTVNGHALSADVTVTKSDVGLGNVPNVDATNASNISSGTLADARLSGNVTLQGNTFNGANQLVKTGSDGKLLPGVIPALALVDTYPTANEAAMLALPAEQGDIAIRTDINVAYILYQAPATTLGNWIPLPAPSSETDPIYTASSWYSTTNNSSNWNTAYSWGNHASAGYLSAATAATTYLPLSGGTLTGGLSGTTALFSALPAMGSNTKYFTMYDAVDGGRLKYTTVANVQSYLGLGSAAYTSSTDYTAANTETLASVTGRGASTSTDLTFNGKLGINHAPESLVNLSIQALGATGSYNPILIRNSAGSGYLYYIDGTGATYQSGSLTAGSISGTTGTFSGDVLIGTGSPNAALSVVRNTASGNISDYAAVTVSNSNGAGYSAYAHYVGATYVGGLRYYAATDALDVQSYGSIVIKTGSSFTTALTLASNQAATFAGKVNVTTTNTAGWNLSVGAANGNGIRLYNGVSSSGGTWDVYTESTYGSIMRLYATDGTTTNITLRGDGQGTFASTVTATAFYEPSDIRLKNILWSKRSADGIPTIAYNWKDSKRDTKLHYGYPAQQVMKYLPDAVELDEKGFYKVDYDQVHTFKISIHDTEIYDLKNRISQLEKQLKR